MSQNEWAELESFSSVLLFAQFAQGVFRTIHLSETLSLCHNHFIQAVRLTVSLSQIRSRHDSKHYHAICFIFLSEKKLCWFISKSSYFLKLQSLLSLGVNTSRHQTKIGHAFTSVSWSALPKKQKRDSVWSRWLHGVLLPQHLPSHLSLPQASLVSSREKGKELHDIWWFQLRPSNIPPLTSVGTFPKFNIYHELHS